MNYFDANALLTDKMHSKLESIGVKPIDDLQDSSIGVHWFVVTSQVQKRTKRGAPYLLLKIVGSAGVSKRMFLWGTKEDTTLPDLSVCVAQLKSDDFGISTTFNKLKIIA